MLLPGGLVAALAFALAHSPCRVCAQEKPSAAAPDPAAAQPPAASEPGPGQVRNVLFITVDDMNWDSAGAFGCPVENITPNIDALAAEGLRFEKAHVTIAICMPTRAVWMTGRYPHRSGALGFDRIRPNVPSLPEHLRTEGFTLGLLGKVPHVIPSRAHAWDKISDARDLGNGRDPDRYYEETLDFLKSAAQSGQRFFLMANTADPHRPFAGSQQEQQKAKRAQTATAAGGKKNNPKKKAAATENADGEEDGDAGAGRAPSRVYQPGEIVVPPFLPDLPEVRQELAEYFTSVHRADESVGAILKALEESGLADQTLVMFMSDHGMPLPFAKTNCYLHSTQTPWIVRWPGVVQPGMIDAAHMISGIDFAPTVLEALGLEPMDGMDGRSFLPLLKGENQDGRDEVWTHINRTSGSREYPMRSVLGPRYGYIWNGWSDGKEIFRNESQSGLTMNAMKDAARQDVELQARVDLFLTRVPEEFYDYEKDPGALHNLIDDPSHQKRIHAARERMRHLMTETGDPQLEAFEATVGGKKGR